MSYSGRLFKFIERPVNVEGVIAAAGGAVAPVISMSLVPQIMALIELQVSIAAEVLSAKLRLTYARDMGNIEEYARFPRYISIMDSALMRQDIGVTLNRQKVYQAKFVDSDTLGDLKMLQEIQHQVYPGKGNLSRWIGLYNAWLEGLSTGSKYAETINKRLDIMLERGVAPFWDLIERGNQQYPAYPQNGPMLTMKKFKTEFKREMMNAWYRILSMARPMIARIMTQNFVKFRAAAISTVGNRVIGGYIWVSRTGRAVFAKSGSEWMVGSRVYARGYLLSQEGEILRGWAGRLPQ
jgi:hypothetical protein